MKQENTLKRFSVDVYGHIIAVFDTLPEARAFVESAWWYPIITIFDNKRRREIVTEIRI